jgi:hypothetical protein
MTEIRQKPDNSSRPLITGWALWWQVNMRNQEKGTSYRDPAFPACPECHSPNVRLMVTRRSKPSRYWCLDCKSQDTCGVEGSTGIERRRAQIRTAVFFTVILAALLAFLVLTGGGAGS